jgi:hypothetical protein
MNLKRTESGASVKAVPWPGWPHTAAVSPAPVLPHVLVEEDGQPPVALNVELQGHSSTAQHSTAEHSRVMGGEAIYP